ncbi:hypothetical protein [Pseudobacter ginsenosidimutans]|uniref:Restriction endonuclease n=1 Tax=Pseudobacter ginsenosidimutans TaxID=661488 RepID=A0A4Q7MT39_9BACT|nr:hypothetical protein [Pseudobacter ginsenosidimutans]QEC41558.1 hypothetical protein FSB84_07540 [Pseudobacter ginsenosidimutans]RZS71658.1 hypothetical protein EV199_3566 [Pseudobacter ginsenosidimutans]
MKIAQVGTQFSQVTQIDFFSSSTFLEYDSLVISLNKIASASRNVRRDWFDNRKKHLVEFMAFKKVPIVYLAPSKDRVEITENNTFVIKYHSEILPVPKFETEAEAGKTISVIPKTPFTEFLEKYKTWFGYDRFYKHVVGTPIAVTPYTNKILAFYTDEAVFLPQIVSKDDRLEKDFLSELFECIIKVRFDSKNFKLPEWTETYFFPGEYEAKNKIEQLNSQIEILQNELAKSEVDIQAIREKKKLITASGNELEKKVEEIFKELGFEILQAERNRDDLIVRYGTDIAVVEIKGLTNSAGEKNAAQLEKWRATYLENKGVDPKGILLVNTYRDVPLIERNQPDFPDQMLRYAIGREHCLITTTQLLALYFETLRNPASKEQIVKSLFDTVGRYSNDYKWQNYINVLGS